MNSSTNRITNSRNSLVCELSTKSMGSLPRMIQIQNVLTARYNQLKLERKLFMIRVVHSFMDKVHRSSTTCESFPYPLIESRCCVYVTHGWVWSLFHRYITTTELSPTLFVPKHFILSMYIECTIDIASSGFSEIVRLIYRSPHSLNESITWQTYKAHFRLHSRNIE